MRRGAYMKRNDRFEASLTDEGRSRLLLEAISDYAIYMLDSTGVVTSWNPGARRFKGYEASEIIGQHFSRFYIEEDRQAGLPERALETAARMGSFEQEGWRQRKDGSRFWAHVIIDPIRDPAGGIIGYAKITRDLTERKRAEETLKRSEQQFKLLVQSVTDYAIYMLDPTGRVSSWNLGAERIKGYRPEEIFCVFFAPCNTEKDRESGEPEKALAAAARDGRYERVAWRVRKDGTRFLANIVVDAIRGNDGTLLGFAKITRDVTEQTTVQQALEQAREALFQAQKMEAIGQLTGGVAHDFNNILMAVLSGLELLSKRVPDDPKITSLLGNAARAAGRGTALVQRMLAFARRQELKPGPVDIPVLLRGLTDLLRQTLGPLVIIETRFPDALDLVQVDSNQLELALLNLAMNARDAMPDGGPLVIEAYGEDVQPGHARGLPPGRYVCISVTDTGEGMDEETLARAKEPFFTTKGVGKGTGLGLSMVHGLTEQSGGRLHLRSRKGHGTTAELWLPVADGVAGVSGHGHELAADAPPSTRPLVILAVDDDSLVLQSTVAMLEDLGHTVFEATSGRQALDILRVAKTVDLVITDQAMPNMTGVQLAEIIRAEAPDMPIILATGYAELPAGTGAQLRKLTKPFRQADLARSLAELT